MSPGPCLSRGPTEEPRVSDTAPEGAHLAGEPMVEPEPLVLPALTFDGEVRAPRVATGDGFQIRGSIEMCDPIEAISVPDQDPPPEATLDDCDGNAAFAAVGSFVRCPSERQWSRHDRPGVLVGP